jgi:hypothetical protein
MSIKRATFVIIAILFICTAITKAQVGIGTKKPDKSAVLDLTGTNKGFLAPRMNSSQRLLIAAPARGLMVFDNDSSYFFYFDGAIWKGMNNQSFSIEKLTTVQRLAISSPSKGQLVFDLDSANFYFYNGKSWSALGTTTATNTSPWKKNGANVYLKTNTDQVGIGDSVPDKSAALDISDTGKGLLVPRLSSKQRNAIKSPAKGLLVFDKDSSYFYYYDGKSWRGMFSDTSSSGPWYRSKNDVLLVHNKDSVGVGKTPKFDLDVRNSMNLDSVYKIQGITVLSTKGTENLLVGQDAGKNNTGSQNLLNGDNSG